MSLYKIRKGGFYNILNHLPGIEKSQDIENEKEFRINALLNMPSKGNKDLGRKLKSCNRSSPCDSAACPRCFSQFRKWSFSELSHLSKGKQVSMVTLLFYSRMLTSNELFTYNFEKLKECLATRLKRCGFTCPVIGYLEFDYHSENKRWLPHFHLMVIGEEPALNVLRKKYSHLEQRRSGAKVSRFSGAKVSRFIHVTPLKDRGKQISYLCKGYSSRLEAYQNNEGKRRTKKYRLNTNQLSLSLRIFDSLGMSGRLFLYRSRLYGNEIRVTTTAAVAEEITRCA